MSRPFNHFILFANLLTISKSIFFSSRVTWQNKDTALSRVIPHRNALCPLFYVYHNCCHYYRKVWLTLTFSPFKFLISSCLYLLSARVLSTACCFQKHAPFMRKTSLLVYFDLEIWRKANLFLNTWNCSLIPDYLLSAWKTQVPIILPSHLPFSRLI